MTATPTEPVRYIPSRCSDHRLRLQGLADRVGASVRIDRRRMSWQIAGSSGVWPNADIASISLSYRPSSMQSRRFRADIENIDGRRIAVLSTTWQTVSLMAPQITATAPLSPSCTGVCGGRQQGRADRRHRAENLRRRARAADIARRRDGRASRARVWTGELMARCFWSASPRCLPGRSAALSDATGRGATLSTPAGNACCRSFIAIKRNET